jgi:hypothetical protein
MNSSPFNRVWLLVRAWFGGDRHANDFLNRFLPPNERVVFQGFVDFSDAAVGLAIFYPLDGGSIFISLGTHTASDVVEFADPNGVCHEGAQIYNVAENIGLSSIDSTEALALNPLLEARLRELSLSS